VSVERADENHWSSWLGEGALGGGGISQFLSYPLGLASRPVASVV